MQLLTREQSWRRSGFTLIEMIMVIVILGVLGIAGADFIGQVFRGFAETHARMELYEEGKAAMVRMERELHGMLPNAICVTSDQGATCESDGTPGNEIRFGMIFESNMRGNNLVGRYTELAVDFPMLPGRPPTLTDSNGAATPQVNRIVSVYNRNWSDFAGGGRLFQVTSVSGPVMTFGASQQIDTPSPRQRYYLVDRIVSYRWNSVSKILFREVDTVLAGGSGSYFSTTTAYPLARNVTDFRFYYAAPATARSGIVSLLFAMEKHGQHVDMHKEIHVKNVP